MEFILYRNIHYTPAVFDGYLTHKEKVIGNTITGIFALLGNAIFERNPASQAYTFKIFPLTAPSVLRI
jgi:hypothetical protein